MLLSKQIEIDNRGLTPPEPMVRILDTLKDMGSSDMLVARNDRQPLFLYPELEELGYAYETEPLPDGSFLIKIWKKAKD